MTAKRTLATNRTMRMTDNKTKSPVFSLRYELNTDFQLWLKRMRKGLRGKQETEFTFLSDIFSSASAWSGG